MSEPTIVFVTGVARGIGKTLVETYLSRPNHIVIGSVRDTTSPNAQELNKLPVAASSRLILVKIESSSPTDPAAAIKEVEAAGIDRLDIVIANAGGSGSGLSPLDKVSVEAVTECFQLNALGPLFLFQAVRPFLEKSKSPKFVAITSAVGSIGNMQNFGAHIAPAYGISKASLNWITVAAHCGNPWLTAFVVHPGLVQTDSGNRAAKGMGLDKAPHTKEQSIGAITSLIDGATREKTSAKFFNVIDGSEIPW